MPQFLLSIPHVQLDRGGRNGTRVAYRQSAALAAAAAGPSAAGHSEAQHSTDGVADDDAKGDDDVVEAVPVQVHQRLQSRAQA